MAACTGDQLFDQFSQATEFATVLSAYEALRKTLGIDKSLQGIRFYQHLKTRLTAWKSKSLFTIMDKRVDQKVYSDGKACVGQRVLIVGGGPSGLRMGIEASMLGADVVLVEKRESMTRNNVLHLWPFCIEDMRLLGCKKFYGKFCAGAIDHVGIRQLQLMLLKLALVVGCQVHWKTTMKEIIPPAGPGSKHGWSVTLEPCDHPASKTFYDVIIGADGRRSCIPGFARKEFRGKLALAITANFINRNTSAEAAVEEISGVAYIFNQRFFKDLLAKYKISLENIVYYKDATHYFVMTAKKASLLEKGVLRKDYKDSRELLSRSNVDNKKLEVFSREAADFSTKLPVLDFAINKDGKSDVALFDFTSIYAAENSTRIQEKHGHKLMVTLIGDSLLEPFWPMGTGCARSFLSVYDTAWAMRSFAKKSCNPIDLLVERESIYHLLPSTTPEKLMTKFKEYTIDPNTRYPNLNTKSFKRSDAQSLFWTAEMIEKPAMAGETEPRFRARSDENLSEKIPEKPCTSVSSAVSAGGSLAAGVVSDAEKGKKLRRTSTLDAWRRASRNITQKSRRVRLSQRVAPKSASNTTILLAWCKDIAGKNGVRVDNFHSSWANGLAFCAILHYYLPKAIKFSNLKPRNGQANCQLAFDTAQRCLSIHSNLSAADVGEADDLTIISYLSQYYQKLSSCQPGKVQTNEASLVLAKKETTGQWTGLEQRTTVSQMASIAASRDKAGGASSSSEVSTRNTSTGSQASASSAPAAFAEEPVESKKAGGKRRAPSAPSALEPASSPHYSRSLSKSDMCHACNKRVYVVERVTAEGYYFHRSCWRCQHCDMQLGPGKYAYVKDKQTFFCKPHYKQLFMSNPSAIGYDRAKVSASSQSSLPASPPRQEPAAAVAAIAQAGSPAAPAEDDVPQRLTRSKTKARAPAPPQPDQPMLPKERISKMLEEGECLGDEEEDDVWDEETARKIELKQGQNRRLHAAQQIQFEMGLLDQQQVELEEESKTVEEGLRDVDTTPEDHDLLMAEWMSIINERNMLVRHEWELSLLFKDLQYEDVRQQIESDLRKRQMTPEHRKNGKDKAEEAHLLEQLIEVVENRDKLVNETEEERIRDLEMDRAVEDTMRKKGYNPRRESGMSSGGFWTPPTTSKLGGKKGKSKKSKET